MLPAQNYFNLKIIYSAIHVWASRSTVLSLLCLHVRGLKWANPDMLFPDATPISAISQYCAVHGNSCNVSVFQKTNSRKSKWSLLWMMMLDTCRSGLHCWRILLSTSAWKISSIQSSLTSWPGIHTQTFTVHSIGPQHCWCCKGFGMLLLE